MHLEDVGAHVSAGVGSSPVTHLQASFGAYNSSEVLDHLAEGGFLLKATLNLVSSLCIILTRGCP